MSEKKESSLAKTYKQILTMGKDAVEAIKLPFKVREAKNKLSGEIIKIEGKIAQGDLDIANAKAVHPLDLSTILEAIDKKELLERQLKQAQNLMEELFPEEA